MHKTHLLAISGSLRLASYNTAALHALSALAPADVEIVIADISALPLFNPDCENDYIPALATIKSLLTKAHGLIIASPEYAHGISGPMKNALDWLVSSTDFPCKPVMLLNTSPRASHAQAALREVLNTMSANIIEDACLALPLQGSGLVDREIADNQAMADCLRSALSEFCREIRLIQAEER